MTYRTALSFVVVLGVALLASSSTTISGQDSVGLQDSRPAIKVEAVRQYLDGYVVSVSKDKLVLRSIAAGGPQRTLRPSRVFDNDGFPHDQTPDSLYRLSDVQIGDKVNVEYTRMTDGREICDAICIRRRPGGCVPRSHQPSNAIELYHERANAYQDLEERGIPLPEKYDGLKIAAKALAQAAEIEKLRARPPVPESIPQAKP